MKWMMWVLVASGALWGLVGIGQILGTNLNIVNLVFNGSPTVESLVYIFIGACAVYVMYHSSKRR